jgi:hypothetical protein
LGETVEKFREAAMVRVEEAASSVAGNAEFRSAFKNQLLNQAGQYIQQARSEQIKAQYGLAKTYIDDMTGKMAQDIVMSPDKLDDYMTLYNMGLDKFEGSFDRNVVSEMRRAGASDLVQSAVRAMQDNGNWKAAREIMDRPDMKELMNGENGLRLRLQRQLQPKPRALSGLTFEANFSAQQLCQAA